MTREINKSLFPCQLPEKYHDMFLCDQVKHSDLKKVVKWLRLLKTVRKIWMNSHKNTSIEVLIEHFYTMSNKAICGPRFQSKNHCNHKKD